VFEISDVGRLLAAESLSNRCCKAGSHVYIAQLTIIGAQPGRLPCLSTCALTQNTQKKQVEKKSLAAAANCDYLRITSHEGLKWEISGDYWQQRVEFCLCCKAGSRVSVAQQINGSCATRTATVPQYLCSEIWFRQSNQMKKKQ
jgi:hypothetical protein